MTIITNKIVKITYIVKKINEFGLLIINFHYYTIRTILQIHEQ